MSTVPTPNDDPNLPDAAKLDIKNPASNRQVFIAGTCYLIFALLMFYVLVASWPTPDASAAVGAAGGAGAAGGPKGFKAFQLFGTSYPDWSSDQRMFLTVIAAGAVGSLIHTLTSLGDYIGNQKLSGNWLWWFVLRTPIGVALALVFYLLLRGGLIVPTMQQTGGSQDATALISPYGIAGFSALAGMFSRQATDKLREVFETLFTAQKPVKRDDPLNAKQPLTITPSTLNRGDTSILTVTGSGFQTATTATINGNNRTFTLVSATQGTVKPDAADVANPGKIEIVITNPNKDQFAATVDVV
jgi:hypothetical protein